MNKKKMNTKKTAFGYRLQFSTWFCLLNPEHRVNALIIKINNFCLHERNHTEHN